MRTANIGLLTVLVGTMAASSLALFGLSVLAADIIEEFDITRSEIGILLAVNTAAGAALAPWLGRVTDRMGARRSIIALLLVSAVGLAMVAVAQSYPALLVGSVVAGAPQGWGNPATNKLIVERLPEGRRGTVLGIKQSGVQVSVFLSGATLPLAANGFGWRWAMGGYSFVAIALTVLAATVLDEAKSRPSPGSKAASRSSTPLGPMVITVAIYAAAMGMAGGMINRFIPLFAHEELGYSTAVAGLVAALTGLLAIGTRIWISRFAEIRGATVAPLVAMGLGASLTALMLATATTVGGWILWPAAIAGAFSVSAWDGVAMLRVVNGVEPDSAGRASGVVIFGFLAGLAAGAPVAGWSVDRWNTYGVAWGAALMLGLVATAAIVSPTSRGSRPVSARADEAVRRTA